MVQEEVYKPRFWVAFTSNVILLIFLAFGVYLLINQLINYSSLATHTDIIVTGCVTLIPFLLFAFVLYRYFVTSNQVLILSNDSDIFYFGERSNEIKYNKKDVTRVLIYQPGGGAGRSMHYFYVYEIYFKDGAKIKFSNFYLSEQKMIASFPGDLIRYSSNYTFFRI